jgi:putative endonuclease
MRPRCSETWRVDVLYFVYILECADGSLYTGITTDVARRFAEHQSGIGSHFTRARGATRIVYSEEQPHRSAAQKREAEIKSWPRIKKLALVAKG